MTGSSVSMQDSGEGRTPEDVKMRAATAILDTTKILPPLAAEKLFDAVIAAIMADRASRLSSSSPSVDVGSEGRLTQVPASGAAADVLAERRRQVEAEGWTLEHDDHHRDGALAVAAAGYAAFASADLVTRDIASYPPSDWPFAEAAWKPKNQRADLVRAGALILAEIERLDRAALGGKANG